MLDVRLPDLLQAMALDRSHNSQIAGTNVLGLGFEFRPYGRVKNLDRPRHRGGILQKCNPCKRRGRMA